jgi:hypothetical protein
MARGITFATLYGGDTFNSRLPSGVVLAITFAGRTVALGPSGDNHSLLWRDGKSSPGQSAQSGSGHCS